MSQRWPQRLWIVRHGESAGNVAAAAAEAAGHPHIQLDMRDADVPLSPLGRQQARALGHWFAALDEGPDVILASPFVRTRQTAELVAEASTVVHDKVIDERLREREFGILDRLTRSGITALHPQQAEALTLVGKFYHRPPGGESWADVILRLRALLDTISLHHAGQRVLIVAHQVVVLCLRYILEGHDEAAILAIDRAEDVANCSVTEYEFIADERGRECPRLLIYNFTAPMTEEATPVTSAPDQPVAAG
ncbi:histidine phosphatase family protein [Polymorphobacter sp.]|uniref:histidine phosphatase family protein n=1 Tax=Polymorphobacter sp. TaxID=1909290 RepID=UPI003F6FF26A